MKTIIIVFFFLALFSGCNNEQVTGKNSATASIKDTPPVTTTFLYEQKFTNEDLATILDGVWGFAYSNIGNGTISNFGYSAFVQIDNGNYVLVNAEVLSSVNSPSDYIKSVYENALPSDTEGNTVKIILTIVR